MSDTKALEKVLSNNRCSDYASPSVVAQAAAELSQLRAENAELREAHARIATMVFALAEDARDFARRTSSAVLGKYPEEETK